MHQLIDVMSGAEAGSLKWSILFLIAPVVIGYPRLDSSGTNDLNKESHSDITKYLLNEHITDVICET